MYFTCWIVILAVMIVLHASIQIDPDRRDEALELVETLVQQSNQEDGMIEYRAAVDVQDENTIRFFEQYEDAESFEAHTQAEHYQAFTETVPELLTDMPEAIQFEVSDTAVPEL